jgi:hypothetical protein
MKVEQLSTTVLIGQLFLSFYSLTIFVYGLIDKLLCKVADLRWHL